MSDATDRHKSKPTAEEEYEVERPPLTKSPRPITLYDAVAGRAGLNGFLTPAQQRSDNVLPVAPEAVLLNRKTIPQDLLSQFNDAAGGLPDSKKLPESEMLKAIHTYATDFYESAAKEQGRYDFRSLDETALIALGILLEEAVKEELGENGDMVFVEREGLEHGLDETNLTKYQIQGRVKPARRQEESEDDNIAEDESPAKKQRR